MFQMLDVSSDRRPSAGLTGDPSADRSCASPLLTEDARTWATQLADYVRDVPQPAVGDDATDLADCLAWLSDGDFTNCSHPTADPRSLGAVESVAIRQWLCHLRFQSHLRRSRAILAEATPRSRLKVQLNPTHVWSRVEPRPWHAAAGDCAASLSQTILLVAIGDDTRTVAVPPHVADWLRCLERSGPQRLRTALACLATHPGDDALDLLRQLAAAGVIAVA